MTFFSIFTPMVVKYSSENLQSNDYFELDEHINCSKTLDEFVKKSKLNVETANELQLAKYKRFMIIGTQHV